ncbi:MAG TPA: sulfurtransferase TusA family protein [Burkholderiales bacterium]
MADQELDVRGLSCPLPILKTKKALNSMQSGQTIRVLATDPGSMLDFKAFAAQTGNALLEAAEADGVYTFVIRKA